MTVLRPNGEHTQSLDQDARLAPVHRDLVLQAPIVVSAALVAHELEVVPVQADQHRTLGSRHVLHGGRVVPTEDGGQLGGAQRELGGGRGGGSRRFGDRSGHVDRIGSALLAGLTNNSDRRPVDGLCFSVS